MMGMQPPDSMLPWGERLRIMVADCPRWTWLTGNHDPAPPLGFGGEVHSEVRLGPLAFRHEPLPRMVGEVAGHLHPKIRIATRARRISARCFITDGLRVVLPAFGALTGGLDIRDAAIRGVVSNEACRSGFGTTAGACGGRAVKAFDWVVAHDR